MIYFKYYLGGVILLGLPYLFFVYFGIIHKQFALSILSLVILGLTVFRWLRSIELL